MKHFERLIVQHRDCIEIEQISKGCHWISSLYCPEPLGTQQDMCMRRCTSVKLLSRVDDLCSTENNLTRSTGETMWSWPLKLYNSDACGERVNSLKFLRTHISDRLKWADSTTAVTILPRSTNTTTCVRSCWCFSHLVSECLPLGRW